MGKRVQRCFIIAFRMGLFCGYFYILFINLACGFSIGGINSKWEAIKILAMAFALAVGFPGIIWYQQYKIEKLEGELRERSEGAIDSKEI